MRARELSEAAGELSRWNDGNNARVKEHIVAAAAAGWQAPKSNRAALEDLEEADATRSGSAEPNKWHI